MNDHAKHMASAIAWAETCMPIEPRIPKVGAIIVVNDVVIGTGFRGSGAQGDDDHAEKRALASVADQKELSNATVYTTLEPCTPEVRSDPLDCCSERLHRARVRKVLIGILDPNQGVTGKGLWALQSAGIAVELFPHDLAQQIRSINEAFISEQQTLGIHIADPEDHATIRTYDRGGTYTMSGSFRHPPGDDVFAITNIGGRWWPQPYALSVDELQQRWSVKVHFGGYGPHVLAIVRANDLGKALVNYYRKITNRLEGARRNVTTYAEGKELGSHLPSLLESVGGAYPPIDMMRLPKGLRLQAQVNVTVEEKPK
jgi:pyrimidine deaminase RibD-like protein